MADVLRKFGLTTRLQIPGTASPYRELLQVA